MRQIILDTETTGLSPQSGHRVIEIGAVELINRRLTGNHFHYYLNPDRDIDAGAQAVHGITREFLQDKPRFNDILEEFIDYIKDADIIIHNAPFDVGFINHEMSLCKHSKDLEHYANEIIDTLVLARHKHPGQKNSLDACCKRYGVDNSNRELHGALLDSEILAEVFLAMTGGQETLTLSGQPATPAKTPVHTETVQIESHAQFTVPIKKASGEELTAHEEYLDFLKKSSESS